MGMFDYFEKRYTDLEKKLVKAVGARSEKEVRRLLELGADVHYDNERCLMKAAGMGFHELIPILREYGAGLDIGYKEKSEGENLLYLAVCSGSTETFQSLIDAGCIAEGENGLFSKAVNENNLAMLKLVVKHGARKFSGSSVLPDVARRGFTEIARYLMEEEHEAGTSLRTLSLSEAIREGHKEMADLLIEHGADIRHECIMNCIAYQGGPEEIRHALELGADIAACSEETLEGIVKRNKPENLALLLERGAKFDFRTCGPEHLETAIQQGNIGMAALLMAQGVLLADADDAWRKAGLYADVKLTVARYKAPHALQTSTRETLAASLENGTTREALLTGDGKPTELLLLAFGTAVGDEIVKLEYWPENPRDGARLWHDIHRALPPALRARSYDPVDATHLLAAASREAFGDQNWGIKIISQPVSLGRTERR